MLDDFSRRGFLPSQDPVKQFTRYPALTALTDWGEQLPAVLEEHHTARKVLGALKIPQWPKDEIEEPDIPELRLYYVRLGFIASGYINLIGAPECNVLPSNIAVPLVRACQLLKRPPILSYDGYALYNWYRLDTALPIKLGNIDTIQNFVKLYDEHWFILVHIEIEALAAEALSAIATVTNLLSQTSTKVDPKALIDQALSKIHDSLLAQSAVLRRIPEKMSPLVYFSHFRPYIRFFENVIYEGVNIPAINYRGETGAQSTIMPTLVAFMKIPHAPTELTNHLMDMRRYMPASHRQWLEQVEQLPDIRPWADPVRFNAVLDAMAEFREIHFQWAEEYINSKVKDPRGTGGTPYMAWLKQLIDETRQCKLQ